MSSPLELESHSLEQLGKVMALYRRAEVSPRDALFLVTQLVNHGYAEAGGVLDALSRDITNEIARDYLVRLAMRHRAIQSLPGLKAVLADREAMEKLYATEGYLFRRGTERADTAVVIFTTRYNNYHFSNAVLDALLSGLGVSRLFLKDTTKYMYLRGVKRLAKDLRDLPAALLGYLKLKGIKRYIITGFSSGGYPSLFAAQAMRPIGHVGYSVSTDVADHAQVARPQMFEKIRRDVPAELFMNLSDLLNAQSNSFPSFLFYGDRNARDKAHAELLRGCAGFEFEGVMGSPHDVTSFLLEEGRFADPFRQLLAS